jgi:phosphoglycolate phosphatase
MGGREIVQETAKAKRRIVLTQRDLDLLIFDLDGTLIDSKRDLANSVNATRVHMRREPIDDEVVSSWVGNGAPVLIRRAMGAEASEAEVERALAYFLAWYREHMLDNTVLYPGVREGLDELREAGLKMAVLTNKPVKFSQTLVEGLGVAPHFFQVYGGNSFDQKKPDPVGIGVLRKETGAAADRTLMIGDSPVDVRTARNAGVPCCGVLWGLQPESLQSEAPDLLVDRMEELTAYVLRRSTVRP